MKNSFVLFDSQFELIEELTIEERGLLLTALYEYRRGKEIDLPVTCRIVFKSLISVIKIADEKYEKKCELNTENGKKGGRPKGDVKNNPPQKKEVAKIAHFIPPTREEVKKYCLEKKVTEWINSDCFVDYYTANGWMVGKNKMKDWKAAVRTWVIKEQKAHPSPYRNVDEESLYVQL